jgi:hypothetical protein
MSPNERPDDGAGERLVVERPPPGLARGKYPAPAWVVATLGAIVILAGLAYLARRLLKGARR